MAKVRIGKGALGWPIVGPLSRPDFDGPRFALGSASVLVLF